MDGGGKGGAETEWVPCEVDGREKGACSVGIGCLPWLMVESGMGCWLEESSGFATSAWLAGIVTIGTSHVSSTGCAAVSVSRASLLVAAAIADGSRGVFRLLFLRAGALLLALDFLLFGAGAELEGSAGACKSGSSGLESRTVSIFLANGRVRRGGILVVGSELGTGCESDSRAVAGTPR